MAENTNSNNSLASDSRGDEVKYVTDRIEPGTFKCSVFVRLVDTIAYRRYLADPQRYPNPYPELTSREAKTQ